jgi:hypothetical protein
LPHFRGLESGRRPRTYSPPAGPDPRQFVGPLDPRRFPQHQLNRRISNGNTRKHVWNPASRRCASKDERAPDLWEAPLPPVLNSCPGRPGCLLVTWSNQGTVAKNACSARIYVDTESHLFGQFAPGICSATVPADGGEVPTPRALYLSYVSPGGVESRKVFASGSAAAQINGGAPPGNPQPPAGALNPPPGPPGTLGNGGGRKQYPTY